MCIGRMRWAVATLCAGVTICGCAAFARGGKPPAQAAADSILCWASRSLGPQRHLVVDLRLKSGGSREPTTEDLRAITALGGRVLYRFHVSVVRAAVDTTALRALIGARHGVADVAYPVTDTTRRDVWVQVFYRRPMVAADDSVLHQLGGTGLWKRPNRRMVSVTVPDSLVPTIAALPEVQLVRAEAMQCAIAAGGTGG